MPPASEEDIESEAVHHVHSMVGWMRDLDHDGATWRVGTTSGEELSRMMTGPHIWYGICG